MKNHTSHPTTEAGAATTGFVLALTIAVATYIVMANQGADHVLSVAVGFAVFLVVGGGVGLGGRRRSRS